MPFQPGLVGVGGYYALLKGDYQQQWCPGNSREGIVGTRGHNKKDEKGKY